MVSSIEPPIEELRDDAVAFTGAFVRGLFARLFSNRANPTFLSRTARRRL
jgi:hypothetical protein